MSRIIGVIDDDISVRKGLSRLLRSAGFRVVVFASAEECLVSDQLGAFACLIIDINLGGATGIEFKWRLRLAGYEMPTIFITAQDEATTETALRQIGSPECIRKPFDAATIIAALDRAIS